MGVCVCVLCVGGGGGGGLVVLFLEQYWRVPIHMHGETMSK